MKRYVYIAIALALASLAIYASSMFFGTSTTSASALRANMVLWSAFRLPSDATDVNCRSDMFGCEAEFAIGRESLMAWLSGIGVTPTPIADPVPYFTPVIMDWDERLIQAGFEFTLPDGRGVYDTDRSRAAFWVSTFP